jgi:hypothetical protein
VLTSRLSRVLLTLAVFTAAALAQVARPKGAVVGEVTKPLPTLAPPPPPPPPPAPAAAGATGYSIRVTSGPPLPAGSGTWFTSYCGYAGKHVVGGGVQTSSPGDTQIMNSYPVDQSIDPSTQTGAWKAFVSNTSRSVTITVKVYVICLDAAS